MKLSTLHKSGGYAIIIGAFLFAVWAVCWTFLLPNPEQVKDFTITVSSPHWIWINSLALPAMFLTVFGFTALYSRMYEKSGWLGFTGYIFITTAYILQAAMLTWEIFLYPVFVSYKPSAALLRDNIMLNHPMVSIFNYLFMITIFLGVLLFGIALIRFPGFKKIGGILFLAGALIYAVAPSIYLSIISVLAFSAGCFILGMNLMKQE
ncbi:MAG: hypothetical protein N2484_14890 [Clostridia bacterium]|nr:hypothetical protein [Clostridia bacterium]